MPRRVVSTGQGVLLDEVQDAAVFEGVLVISPAKEHVVIPGLEADGLLDDEVDVVVGRSTVLPGEQERGPERLPHLDGRLDVTEPEDAANEGSNAALESDEEDCCTLSDRSFVIQEDQAEEVDHEREGERSSDATYGSVDREDPEEIEVAAVLVSTGHWHLREDLSKKREKIKEYFVFEI